MVQEMGVEPTRFLNQRIFLLLHVTMTHFRSCSLDYFFSMLYSLGSWYIVSTHYFGLLKLYFDLYKFQLKRDNLDINILN